MIYQVRASLFFSVHDEAVDFFGDCQLALVKSVVVHPDDPAVERPRVELIKCYHDEQPTKPCEIVECLTSA